MYKATNQHGSKLVLFGFNLHFHPENSLNLENVATLSLHIKSLDINFSCIKINLSFTLTRPLSMHPQGMTTTLYMSCAV